MLASSPKQRPFVFEAVPEGPRGFSETGANSARARKLPVSLILC